MKPIALLLLLAGQAAPPGLHDVRQLTSDGTHAEAYFSPDGKKLVLMAQRDGDKADQIYELDIATKALTRVSTGKGKTTGKQPPPPPPGKDTDKEKKDRANMVNGAAESALAAVTQQNFRTADEWEKWWGKNRSTFAPK